VQELERKEKEVKPGLRSQDENVLRRRMGAYWAHFSTAHGAMSKGLESGKDGMIVQFRGSSRQVGGKGSVESHKSCKQSQKESMCVGHGCLAWAKPGGGVFI